MKVKTVEGKEFSSVQGVALLDSAINAGLIFEYSCKNGQCGVCKTALLEGEVKELKPQLSLTQQDCEKGMVLSCCCEPVSDVLIDAEDLSALHGIEVKTLPARINAIEQKSAGIVKVKLRLPPSADFQFLEGQYIDVIGPNGVQRSYSVASTSANKEIALLIKKVEGGVLSEYWFEVAKENDLVRIEGPKGTFFVRDVNKPLLFLGTGTGIAPIISMLKRLNEDKSFVQKFPIYVFWGNRHVEDFVWKPVLKKLNVEFYQVLSRSDEVWDKSVGYVQDVALGTVPSIKEFHVYACGSNQMIQNARELFCGAGLLEKNFFSDAFVQSY